jgi:SAM-dependent methyltransferase
MTTSSPHMAAFRRAILACPACHGTLTWTGARSACGSCGARYGEREGIPSLFAPGEEPPQGTTAPAPSAIRVPAPLRGVIARVRRVLDRPLVWRTDESHDLVRRFVASFEPSRHIINIGAGMRRYGENVTNLEIGPREGLDVLGAGERLPVADGGVSGVVLEAVLEHVPDAEQTLAEIHRVLEPGGRAFIDVPFLQPYHGSPGDYRRFTQGGLCAKMEQSGFRVVDSGVSLGPASAFTWISAHCLAMLFTGRSNRGYRAARYVFAFLLSPIRYADRWLESHPSAHVVASGVWVIAEKRADSPDRGGGARARAAADGR